MEKTVEQMYRTLQTGMQAAAELPITRQVLDERRDAIITAAINAFEAIPSKLDGTGALVFVAALSENRKLLDALERKVTDATRQQKALEKTASTTVN